MPLTQLVELPFAATAVIVNLLKILKYIELSQKKNLFQFKSIVLIKSEQQITLRHTLMMCQILQSVNVNCAFVLMWTCCILKNVLTRMTLIDLTLRRSVWCWWIPLEFETYKNTSVNVDVCCITDNFPQRKFGQVKWREPPLYMNRLNRFNQA